MLSVCMLCYNLFTLESVADSWRGNQQVFAGICLSLMFKIIVLTDLVVFLLMPELTWSYLLTFLWTSKTSAPSLH